MNLIGKWKVKELPVYPEPCKTIFVAVEELPKYITDEDLLNEYMPVSYTHLTLPTNREV